MGLLNRENENRDGVALELRVRGFGCRAWQCGGSFVAGLEYIF